MVSKVVLADQEADGEEFPVMVKKVPPPIRRGAPRGHNPKRVAMVSKIVTALQADPGNWYQVSVSPQVAKNWRTIKPEFEQITVQSRAPQYRGGPRETYVCWGEPNDH